MGETQITASRARCTCASMYHTFFYVSTGTVLCPLGKVVHLLVALISAFIHTFDIYRKIHITNILVGGLSDFLSDHNVENFDNTGAATLSTCSAAELATAEHC